MDIRERMKFPVKSHLRRTQSGNVVEVSAHRRSQPEWYVDFFEKMDQTIKAKARRLKENGRLL